MTAVTDTIRNGVDTEMMFATLDLIKDQPELAKFQFRATNRWIGGSHNRSTISRSLSSGALPVTRNATLIRSNPLRGPSSTPSAPRTSMSPVRVDSTDVSSTLRAAAT